MRGITNALLFVAVWLFVVVVTVGIGLVLVPVYWFFVFRATEARAEKAQQKLQAALIKTEKIETSALQFRLFALFHRRQLIAVTNSRFILLSRSIFGGFVMRDYQWKDLQDVQLSENVLPDVCGSRLSFVVSRSSPAIVVDGISSDVASTIYAQAQAHEQEWEEKRRIRDLEEKRATSGGMILHTGTGAQADAGRSTLDDLERAKKLFDTGTVSDAEYQEIKSKILSRGAF
jgi:signal transduction histidine kinase